MVVYFELAADVQLIHAEFPGNILEGYFGKLKKDESNSFMDVPQDAWWLPLRRIVKIFDSCSIPPGLQ